MRKIVLVHFFALQNRRYVTANISRSYEKIFLLDSNLRMCNKMQSIVAFSSKARAVFLM